jgi:tRNA-Thr(GGU) m(6)t(6)A37 methyltransferase TsaA
MKSTGPDKHPAYSFAPIGIIHSCFTEKFGIPRQAGLIPEAGAVLEILAPYNRSEAFRGLDAFSHIWVLFVFHACIREKWKPTVRPPRLGGNKRMGVFAGRSGFRPSPIGLSAVKLEKIAQEQGKLLLYLSGADMLDQTPVLDIKPYLPYADCIPDAVGGYAPEPPEVLLPVEFSPEVIEFCLHKEKAEIPHLRQLIIGTLQTDPRPAYYKNKPHKNQFGSRIMDINIRWVFEQGKIRIIEMREQRAEGSEEG